MNIAWMLMVVLSAVIARRCLTLLGVRAEIAGPIGVLYALSPYALYQQPLFCLAIYLLPAPCTMALLIATNRVTAFRPRQLAALGTGCALVGLNYTYYAFFSCFLLLTASVIAYARAWHLRELLHGLSVIVLICVATAINLAPSELSGKEIGSGIHNVAIRIVSGDRQCFYATSPVPVVIQ